MSNAIAVSFGNAFDDSVKTQTAQLIAHLTWSEAVGGLSQQACKVLAEVAVGKTVRLELKQEDGTPKGLHLGIGEVERGDTLGCHLQRTVDFLKGLFGEDAVVADALYLKQSSIGLKA